MKRLRTRPCKRSQPLKAVISLTDLPSSDTFTFMLCDPAKSHFAVLIFLLPRNKDTKTNRGKFFRSQWKHMDIETKCLAFEYVHLESFAHLPVYSLKKHCCRSWSRHCTRHWKQKMNKAYSVPPLQNRGDFPQELLKQKTYVLPGLPILVAYNCLEVLGLGDLGKVGGYITFLGGPGSFKRGNGTAFSFSIFLHFGDRMGTMKRERDEGWMLNSKKCHHCGLSDSHGRTPACGFEVLLQTEKRCLICKGGFNWLVTSIS